MKKCPYCAEEIQDEAILCRYCGHNLLPQSPILENKQSPFQNQTKPNKRSNCILWAVVFILLGFCFLIIFIKPPSKENGSIDSSTLQNNLIGTKTVIPIKKILPSITPALLSINDIELNKEQLTDVQWKEYSHGLIGIRVHWIATVNNVNDRGSVYLDIDQNFLTSISLDGLPIDVAKSLNKGQVIEFEATIKDVSEFLGLMIKLNNPIIMGTN